MSKCSWFIPSIGVDAASQAERKRLLPILESDPGVGQILLLNLLAQALYWRPEGVRMSGPLSPAPIPPWEWCSLALSSTWAHDELFMPMCICGFKGNKLPLSKLLPLHLTYQKLPLSLFVSRGVPHPQGHQEWCANPPGPCPRALSTPLLWFAVQLCLS